MHDPQATLIETYPECVTDTSTELLVEKLVHAHTTLEVRESFDDTHFIPIYITRVLLIYQLE